MVTTLLLSNSNDNGIASSLSSPSCVQSVAVIQEEPSKLVLEEAAMLKKDQSLLTGNDDTATAKYCDYTRCFVRNNDKKRLSLDEFVEEIPKLLHSSKHEKETIIPSLDEDPITKLFNRLQLEKKDWKPYAFFDSTKNYTRNLISTDNETYTLLLLCWNPNRESLIHDHPCDGCWMKVCHGQVQECRYKEVASTRNPLEESFGEEEGRNIKLQCISNIIAKEGDVVSIEDSMGYHKIGNPSETEFAVSLHLYCPPIQYCRVWDNESCTVPSQAKMCNYSEYGKVVS